jgi:starvation-inducible DNA-binding protein
MTSTAHSTRFPALAEPHQRAEVGGRLRALLVELVDLSLLGKRLQWNVVGPLFSPLHLQLDKLIDSWWQPADTVAEQAVAMSVSPDGQSATVTKDSPLREIDRGELEDHRVVQELTSRPAEVAERARERMHRLSDLDAASQDVVIEVVRALEKQLWMIRAQFPERGVH